MDTEFLQVTIPLVTILLVTAEFLLVTIPLDIIPAILRISMVLGPPCMEMAMLEEQQMASIQDLGQFQEMLVLE